MKTQGPEDKTSASTPNKSPLARFFGFFKNLLTQFTNWLSGLFKSKKKPNLEEGTSNLETQQGPETTASEEEEPVVKQELTPDQKAALSKAKEEAQKQIAAAEAFLETNKTTHEAIPSDARNLQELINSLKPICEGKSKSSYIVIVGDITGMTGAIASILGGFERQTRVRNEELASAKAQKIEAEEFLESHHDSLSKQDEEDFKKAIEKVEEYLSPKVPGYIVASSVRTAYKRLAELTNRLKKQQLVSSSQKEEPAANLDQQNKGKEETEQTQQAKQEPRAQAQKQFEQDREAVRAKAQEQVDASIAFVRQHNQNLSADDNRNLRHAIAPLEEMLRQRGNAFPALLARNNTETLHNLTEKFKAQVAALHPAQDNADEPDYSSEEEEEGETPWPPTEEKPQVEEQNKPFRDDSLLQPTQTPPPPRTSAPPAAVGAPSAAAVQEQADKKKREETIRLAKIEAADAKKFLDEAVYTSQFSRKELSYIPQYHLSKTYMTSAVKDIAKIQDYITTETIEDYRKDIRTAREILEPLVDQKNKLRIRAGSRTRMGGILGKLIGTSWEKSAGWESLQDYVGRVEEYLNDENFPELTNDDTGLSDFEEALDKLEKFVTAYLEGKDPKEATREIFSTKMEPIEFRADSEGETSPPATVGAPSATISGVSVNLPANLEEIRKPFFGAVARAKQFREENRAFMKANSIKFDLIEDEYLEIESFRDELTSTSQEIEKLARQIDKDVACLQEKINQAKAKVGTVPPTTVGAPSATVPEPKSADKPLSPDDAVIKKILEGAKELQREDYRCAIESVKGNVDIALLYHNRLKNQIDCLESAPNDALPSIFKAIDEIFKECIPLIETKRKLKAEAEKTMEEAEALIKVAEEHHAQETRQECFFLKDALTDVKGEIEGYPHVDAFTISLFEQRKNRLGENLDKLKKKISPSSPGLK